MICRGILEINGKRTEVAREDIRKLKFILDELGIMYIIDDVSFCSTFRVAGRMEDIHDVRMSKSESGDGVLPKNRYGCSELLEFRELKIPYFCLIDFSSLSQLDVEEAEFLGDLIIGIQSCSSVLSRIGQ